MVFESLILSQRCLAQLRFKYDRLQPVGVAVCKKQTG
jgi:hypothetical protein